MPAPDAAAGRGIDCHAHVFPPAFPLPDGPGHKPEPYQRVTREDFAAEMRRHGLSHAVLSQPSGYGHDNAAMLDAMQADEGRIKGIGNVPYDALDVTLDALERQGVIGHRFNLVDLEPGELARPEAIRFLDRLRERGWWAEVHAHAPWYVELAPLLQRGNKVVLCHMGRPTLERGLQEPGWQRVLELGRDGHAVAKLTGIRRFSRQPFPHADADPFVAALLAAFTPERCVWGSDWPHLLLGPDISYDHGLRWLHHAVPDAAARGRILWDTPRRLFGFAA